MSSQPVSAYWLRVSSSHVRPPARVYGVYCVKSRTTCLPGGATVGSRLEGMTISIIGLKQCTAQYLIHPHFNFKQHNCPMTFVMDPKEHLYKSQWKEWTSFVHIYTHPWHTCVCLSIAPWRSHLIRTEFRILDPKHCKTKPTIFSDINIKLHPPPPPHTHANIQKHVDTPLSSSILIQTGLHVHYPPSYRPHTCSHADNISLIQTPLCLPYIPPCQHPCISLIEITLHLPSCRLTYIFPIQKPQHLPHLPSCRLPQVSLICPNGDYTTSPWPTLTYISLIQKPLCLP